MVGAIPVSGGPVVSADGMGRGYRDRGDSGTQQEVTVQLTHTDTEGNRYEYRLHDDLDELVHTNVGEIPALIVLERHMYDKEGNEVQLP